MSTILNKDLLSEIVAGKLNARQLITTIENEIIEALMVGVRYNQSKAAKALQLSRGTTRTLLSTRFGNKYVGFKG